MRRKSKPDGKDLSLVIPVCNEEENISLLYERLEPVLKKLDKSYEIIFVDDGSSDDSFNILQKLHAQAHEVKVIQFRKNFGKAAALSAGFELAKGKIVITMDADLQDDPREIPNLIEKLGEGYDLVSGWRFERKDPFSKTFPSRFFNYLTSALTGVKIHDFNCGFKAYKQDVIREIDLYGELHRYIPVLAYWRGCKVGETKIKHTRRVYGQSKYGMGRFLRGVTDLLTVMFLTRYIEKPLHLFGGVGLLFLLAGFIVSIYLVIVKILGQGISGRPLLWLGILLIVVGIQVVSVGLLGEMITTTMGRHRQGYIIKKILQ